MLQKQLYIPLGGLSGCCDFYAVQKYYAFMTRAADIGSILSPRIISQLSLL